MAAEDASTYGPFNVGDPADTLTLVAKITANDNSRAWFSHGLAWMYGYNHEEAIGCYTKAVAADPKNAMAWWGIAYSVSSTYNWAPGLGCGYDAIQAAMKLVNDPANSYNPLEVDMIAALSTRSTEAAKKGADPTKLSFGNLPELNTAFAEAMAVVYAKYPGDNDVAAVYVEALMNLKPWALWDRKREGDRIVITPADDNTLLAQKVIESAFEMNERADRHPPLLHLYCHFCELSPFPQKALPYANNLRKAMPDMGHLVHMPSHIDAWVGGYADGIVANTDGVAADDKYCKITGANSQFYKFYRMHNHHFVVWMAMHAGQYERSMEYARKMQSQLSEEEVSFMLAGIIPMGAVFLESYYSMVWHVMIRFGKWDDILNEPIPENSSAYAGAVATANYARGLAHAVKGDIKSAEMCQDAFLAALENPALAGRVLHNNPIWQDPANGGSVLKVAKEMLDGELEYRRCVKNRMSSKADYDKAFDFLRAAVVTSENLAYQEPWAWAVPVRHALGALLLEQDRVEEATEVYEADVELWKDNMWGLTGLEQCYTASKIGNRINIREKLAQCAKISDIKVVATCFCAAKCGADVTKVA